MPAAGVDRDPTEQRRGGLKGRDTCQEGGHFQRTTVRTYDTRVQSKIHSLANLAAARATCQPAAAARRSPTGPPRRAPHPRTLARRMPAGVHPPSATAPPRPRPLARARTRAAGRGGGSRRSVAVVALSGHIRFPALWAGGWGCGRGGQRASAARQAGAIPKPTPQAYVLSLSSVRSVSYRAFWSAARRFSRGESRAPPRRCVGAQVLVARALVTHARSAALADVQDAPDLPAGIKRGPSCCIGWSARG